MWCQVQATSAVSGLGCPLVRSKHAMCLAADGHIYLYGGKSLANQSLRDLWRFDTSQNQWEEVTARNQTQLKPNHHHQQCRLSNSFDEAYSSSSVSSSNSSTSSSPVTVDDRDEPPPPLQEHTIIAVKNKLYLFGGEVGYSSDETPLWIFDLATVRWSKFAPKSGSHSPSVASHTATSRPLGRRGHTAVLYRHLMCIYGGYQDLKGSSAELWTFNFDQQEWSLEGNNPKRDASPPARHGHSAVVFQDAMFVYGGMNNLQVCGDFWSWSFKNRQWNRIKMSRANPGEVAYHSAIVVLDSMFLYGGEQGNGQNTNQLWRFRFASQTWEHMTVEGIVPAIRTRHVAIGNPFLAMFEKETTAKKEMCETSFISQPESSRNAKKSISMCFDDSGQSSSVVSPPNEFKPKSKVIKKSSSFKMTRQTQTDECFEVKSKLEDIENNQNVANQSVEVGQKPLVRMRPRRPLLQKQRPYSDFYAIGTIQDESPEKQFKRRSVQESMSYYSLCFPTPPATLKQLNDSTLSPPSSPPARPKDSPPNYAQLAFSPPPAGQASQETAEEVLVRRRENSSLKRRMRRANLELRELNKALSFMSSTDSGDHYNAYYSLTLDISPDFEKELKLGGGPTLTSPSPEINLSSVTNSHSMEEQYGSAEEMAHLDLDILEDYLEPEEMLEAIVTGGDSLSDEISPTLHMKTIQKTPGHRLRKSVLNQTKTESIASVSHSSSGYQSLVLSDQSNGHSFDYSDHSISSFTESAKSEAKTKVEQYELRPLNHVPPPAKEKSKSSKLRSSHYSRLQSHWEPNIKEVIEEVIVPGSPALPVVPAVKLELSSTSEEDSTTSDQRPVGPKKKPFFRRTRKGVQQQWRLCMYLFGGKEEGVSRGVLNKQSISIWKFYI